MSEALSRRTIYAHGSLGLPLAVIALLAFGAALSFLMRIPPLVQGGLTTLLILAIAAAVVLWLVLLWLGLAVLAADRLYHVRGRGADARCAVFGALAGLSILSPIRSVT